MRAFEDTPGRAQRGSASARLELVVAVAAHHVIGYRGELPWHLSADLKRFRKITTGHSVLMGRRTWDSLRRPLPQRQLIVVTRNATFAAPGAQVAPSLEHALDLVGLPDPVYCIGGGELFATALDLATRIHLTLIDAEFPGDAFFPGIDFRGWREVARESHRRSAEVAFEYAFITYDRVPAPT